MHPNSNDRGSRRKAERDLRHRGRGEGLVKMEAEVGFIVATS